MNELTVRTPTGHCFTVRPMRADDAGIVVAGFRGLSPDSLRHRFFVASAAQVADRLLEQVATLHDGELVILAFDDAGRLAGGARAICDPAESSSAELAITVADRWHGHGLGSALLALMLDQGRSLGLRSYRGWVQVDNRPARALLRRAGASFRFDEPGVLAFDLSLGVRSGMRSHTMAVAS